MAAKQKILIVDDDNNIAELISLYLTKECFDTRIVNDGEEAMIDVITRSMAANYKGIVFDWLKEASTRPAALGCAAKPGYGVQGHHDELNPLERAAVDRVMGPVSKGAARLQQGVQRHGDELDAIQLEAVERMLAENT